MHLQHDMVVCAELFGKGVLGIRPTDRCFSVAKLFFAYGLGNALYFPFSVGATTILWPGAPTPQNVYAVDRDGTSRRCSTRCRPATGCCSRTAGLKACAASAWPTRRDFDLSSIRLAVSAGEALPAALYERFKQRFGVDIIDGIGSTETLHMFISNRPDAIRPGSSGLIVRGYEARLLDDEGDAVLPGEIGNLWIRGDSICAGYWNQHEKTKNTIEGHWIRTGDKYTQDVDGFYWYAGRSDDMLKVGGLWVSPVEVENALVAHAAVLECGVVGREDHDGLVKPMAFVVLRDGAAGSPELATELQQFVRERLAEYKRPRWVEFVAELPKTATGKIQRFRLRSLGATRLQGDITLADRFADHHVGLAAEVVRHVAEHLRHARIRHAPLHGGRRLEVGAEHVLIRRREARDAAGHLHDFALLDAERPHDRAGHRDVLLEVILLVEGDALLVADAQHGHRRGSSRATLPPVLRREVPGIRQNLNVCSNYRAPRPARPLPPVGACRHTVSS